jgi:hypothetical protein
MQECQLGLSCILNSRESLTGTVHQAPLERAECVKMIELFEYDVGECFLVRLGHDFGEDRPCRCRRKETREFFLLKLR